MIKYRQIFSTDKFTSSGAMMGLLNDFIGSYIDKLTKDGCTKYDTIDNCLNFIEYVKSFIPCKSDGTSMFKLTPINECKLVENIDVALKEHKPLPDTVKGSLYSYEILNKILDYIFTDLYEVRDKVMTIAYFKHFLINVKRSILGLKRDDEQLMTLYSTEKGNGKDYFIRQLYDALGTNCRLDYDFCDMFGAFNESLMDAYGFIRLSDPSMVDIDKNKLKRFVTLPTFSVKAKFRDDVDIERRFQVVATTNFDPSGLYRSEGEERRNACINFVGCKGSFDATRLYRLMWSICPVEYNYTPGDLSSMAKSAISDIAISEWNLLGEMLSVDESWDEFTAVGCYDKPFTVNKLISLYRLKNVRLERWQAKRMLDNKEMFTRDGNSRYLIKPLRDIIDKMHSEKVKTLSINILEAADDVISSSAVKREFMKYIEDKSVITFNEWVSNYENDLQAAVDYFTDGIEAEIEALRDAHKYDCFEAYPDIVSVDKVTLETPVCIASTPGAEVRSDTRLDETLVIPKADYPDNKGCLVVEAITPSREEKRFQRINNMMLDFDHDVTLDEIYGMFKDYDYYIYTTKRHSVDELRVRVILPLDKPIVFNEDDTHKHVKLYKTAKSRLFPKHDKGCQCWFYQPGKDCFLGYHQATLNTLYPKRYPSANLESLMETIEMETPVKRIYDGEPADEDAKRAYAVKCADTINKSKEGERNDTINRTLYTAMSKFNDMDVIRAIADLVDGDHRHPLNEVLRAHYPEAVKKKR